MYLDQMHDVFALPGTVAGFATTHPRSDQTSGSSSAAGSAAGLLDPLRRLLAQSRSTAGSRSEDDQAVRTPPQWNPDTAFRIPALKIKLDQASNYEEWHAAAAELDALEGHDAWKLDDECAEYDVALIRAKLREMDNVRLERDQRKILVLLREGVARNLGGIGSLRLYKHTRLGTKALIERYIQSVLDTIKVLIEITNSGQGKLDSGFVRQEIIYARQAFGRSALLLSGGGTYGMHHIGVIRVLWEANLLPRIVSGASAGSIVSAVLCTRTNDEIPQTLADFCTGDLNVFEKQGQETGLLGKAYRLLTQGSLFDIRHLIGVMREMLGDLTFNEAYNRTRRILNICVSSANHFEMPRLLNFVTAPDVIIWSAVAASCSVPLVFAPATLLVKDRETGEHVPWATCNWIDGSVENDIPTQRLSEMFNVNHFIVSQVNPHVVPFLDKGEKELEKEAQNNHAPRTTDQPMLLQLCTLARDEAIHRLHVVEELGILPNVFSKLRAVIGQKYAGDINIFPEIAYSNISNVLSNPTMEFMEQAAISGERATWPKLSEIRNHCAIELAIDSAVSQLTPNPVLGEPYSDSHRLYNPRSPALISSHRARQLKKTAMMRPLRTSLDLPRMALKTPTRQPKELRFNAGGEQLHEPAKKVAGPDLQDFSDSDSETSDGERGWKLSAESSDDESGDTPPSSLHQRWTATRQLFPWASQPATPSIHQGEGSSFFGVNPLSEAATANEDAISVSNMSEAELQYKRLFHKGSTISAAGSQDDVEQISQGPIRRRSISSIAFDPTGTRGMMRRRKLSNVGAGGQ